MRINNKFNMQEKVFLRNDLDQVPGYITGIIIRPEGYKYILSMDREETDHYEFEISRTKSYSVDKPDEDETD